MNSFRSMKLLTRNLIWVELFARKANCWFSYWDKYAYARTAWAPQNSSTKKYKSKVFPNRLVWLFELNPVSIYFRSLKNHYGDIVLTSEGIIQKGNYLNENGKAFLTNYLGFWHEIWYRDWCFVEIKNYFIEEDFRRFKRRACYLLISMLQLKSWYASGFKSTLDRMQPLPLFGKSKRHLAPATSVNGR